MNRPFFALAKVTLGANSNGIASYKLSEGQTFEVKRIVQTSTSTYGITGITLNNGDGLTNASGGNTLDPNIFPKLAQDNNIPADLTDPLILSGNSQINFNLVDTSGSSNVVSIVLMGFLKN